MRTIVPKTVDSGMGLVGVVVDPEIWIKEAESR